jgi:hypothetical protein
MVAHTSSLFVLASGCELATPVLAIVALPVRPSASRRVTHIPIASANPGQRAHVHSRADGPSLENLCYTGRDQVKHLILTCLHLWFRGAPRLADPILESLKALGLGSDRTRPRKRQTRQSRSTNRRPANRGLERPPLIVRALYTTRGFSRALYWWFTSWICFAALLLACSLRTKQTDLGLEAAPTSTSKLRSYCRPAA